MEKSGRNTKLIRGDPECTKKVTENMLLLAKAAFSCITWALTPQKEKNALACRTKPQAIHYVTKGSVV